MNKIALSIIILGLVVGIGIIIFGGSNNDLGTTSVQSSENVEIRDGIQYITIDAKGGYSPRVSSAQSNIPTKLVVRTNGTYDCSAALVIRSVGYQRILPQTGEEVIDIGANLSGESVRGMCSMGMYSFVVNFN
jgi:plastocyanin domain-containing protein